MYKVQTMTLLALVFLLTSCSSLMQYRDPVEHWYLKQLVGRDYQTNPGTTSALVIQSKNNHSRYSKNGYALWLSSQSHFQTKPDMLTGKQLAKLHYKPLTSINIDGKYFTFSYDSQLSCSDEVMQTWQKSFSSFHSAGLFEQFRFPYQVNVRFVSQPSFHTLHRIIPGEWQLNFYFHADCQRLQQPGWSNERFKTIAHEMTHIEQSWVYDNYKQLVQFPPQGKHSQPEPYKLLNEFIAHKLDLCVLIHSTAETVMTDESIAEVSFDLPEDFTEDRSFQTIGRYLLKDIEFGTNQLLTSRLYSDAGRELAFAWVSQFADDDGIIYKSDTTDNEFMHACQTILSEAAIIEAGDEIRQLLSN